MYIGYENDRKQLGYKSLSDLNHQARIKVLKKIPRTRKLFITSTVLGLFLVFSDIPPSNGAVGLTRIPQTRILRHDNFRKSAKVLPSKVRLNFEKRDKITFLKNRELALWICLYDEKFIRNPEVHKLIKQIRGGNKLTEAALTATIVFIFIWQIMMIEGFQPVQPLQQPVFRNGGLVRPVNPNTGIGGVQRQINHPKHRGKMTFRQVQSNESSVNSMQVSSFIKNDIADLRKAFKEVERRASNIACDNFQCSFKRFEALATEGKTPTEGSIREAISALQGEMLGYYKNTVRGKYVKGIAGPDFIIEGLGDYSHITHLEVKNPVGSAIEKANLGVSNLVKQGETIGSKISNQQLKWSNPDFVENISHWNQSESFPQSPANMLGLVDTFDVPMSEKSIIENSVINNSTNSSSVIFLNNETNI
jgi:hypothetical protein